VIGCKNARRKPKINTVDVSR